MAFNYTVLLSPAQSGREDTLLNRALMGLWIFTTRWRALEPPPPSISVARNKRKALGGSSKIITGAITFHLSLPPSAII